MDLSNATRVADFGSGIGTEGAIIKVDDDNQRLGIGTNNPQTTLQVGTGVSFYGNGIVRATAFYGDGSNITNAGSSLDASSGLQRVVVTSQTSGNMTSAATDTDLLFNTSTNTLSAANVSIAGTLTYEDVTNIDSLGIVTARTGVKVTAGGINAVGVVTATSFSGDGSNLSGVESGVVNFVASGTIANGATVIIKDDGTVGIVTIAASSTPSGGTPVVFESADTFRMSTAFDSDNDKVIIAYRDQGNSNYGTAVVGTVSGTSISFGTPVVFESAATSDTSVAYVDNSKVIVVYSDGGDSSKGYYTVGSVSGDTISFAAAAYFYQTAAAYHNSIAYIGSDKVVISYMTGNSPYGASSVVGTRTGNSLTFGTPVEFEVDNSEPRSTIYIGSDKVVVTYKDGSDSDKGKAIVGTVSGTSISFGASATFQSGVLGDLTRNSSTAYDTVNDRVVIAWRNSSDSNHGYASVGTVSGTSISFGTAVEFNDAESFFPVAVYDASSGKVVIAYRDGDNSEAGTAKAGTVSGTSISFGSAYVFESSTNTMYSVGTYDSTNEKVVIAYANEGESNYGTAVVLSMTSTNLTAENYIGIAGEAIANAATGKVNVVGGVNSSQSGLTTAKTYYVGQTGILTTTADTPSVVAGTSISSTKISVR